MSLIKAAIEQGLAHQSRGGHIDLGVRCAVAHGDDEGQCIKCALCGEWVNRIAWENSECAKKVDEPFIDDWLVDIWKTRKGFKYEPEER